MRMAGYDYAEEGAYFVTVVTQGREALFGHVENGKMVLNAFGRIVKEEWVKTGAIRDQVKIADDEFCVMPNHFHGIIWLNGRDTARRVPTESDGPIHKAEFGKPVSNSLSTIIGAFKSSVTRRINRLRNTPGAVVWQGRFYDHIIRDEKDYYNIAEYIDLNALNWEKDEEFPQD